MPNSSFSILKNTKQKNKNSHKTCCQSLRFLQPEIAAEEDTKITRKIRIYPTKKQKIFFNKCFGATRFIYNKTVDESNKNYKNSLLKLNKLAENGCIKIIQEYEFEKYQCENDVINNDIHFCEEHKNKKISKKIQKDILKNEDKCQFIKRKKVITKEYYCCETIKSKFFCEKHKKAKLKFGVDNSFITLRNKIITSNKNLKNSEIWLKEIPYDTRQLAVKDFTIALKAAITNRKRNNNKGFKMGFKSRRTMQTQIFHIDKRTINADLEIFKKLKLGKLRVRKRMKKWFKNNIKSIEDNCKILKHKDGSYYLILSYTHKILKNKKAQFETVALDPGTRSFQTFYSPDGIVGELGKDLVKSTIKPLNDKINKLNAVISTIKKKLKKYKYKRRRKLKQTIRNIRKRQSLTRTKLKNVINDFHWKCADFLCKNFNTIILPNFGTSKMTEKDNRINKTVGKDLLYLRHYAFKMKLKHKCKMRNRLLLIVNENCTTITCGKCGKQTNIGSNKIFKCKHCNYTVDRDINAARNILIRTCSLLVCNNKPTSVSINVKGM
jgi:putative transposase